MKKRNNVLWLRVEMCRVSLVTDRSEQQQENPVKGLHTNSTHSMKQEAVTDTATASNPTFVTQKSAGESVLVPHIMSDMDAPSEMEVDVDKDMAEQPGPSVQPVDAIENPKSPFAPVPAESEQQQLQNQTEAPARNNVMATTSSGTGSVSIALHPLVIMNVAEHWTRSKAQEDRLAVVGALIGRQKGRCMEIMNSFELQVDLIDNMTIINRDYYEQKESQFKQVFPDLDFLGWYAIGEAPTARDIRMHKQICEINESPVFLLLNPQNRQSRLPISMYESVIDLVGGEATLLFSPVAFSLETEEAERIGLDHMARLSSTTSNSDVGASVASDHLRVQFSAVKMLRDRVRIIRDYVVDAKRGNVQWNSDILREAHSLSSRLPLVTSDEFKDEFYNQCNEVALMAYLGSLTKGTNTMNQFVNKFITLYERQGSGRRMRGLFF
jgi:COP9 signalosome complex subunit 6